MDLLIKKAKITVLDKYEVTDSKGNVLFNVKGELISVGKRLRIDDASGRELASVYKKKIAVRDKYVISMKAGDVDVFRIDTMRKVPEYRAKELGWTLKGDFGRKDLKITEGLHTVAHIKPKALSFGETLKMDVRNEAEALPAVALLLVSHLDAENKPENAEEK